MSIGDCREDVMEFLRKFSSLVDITGKRKECENYQLRSGDDEDEGDDPYEEGSSQSADDQDHFQQSSKRRRTKNTGFEAIHRDPLDDKILSKKKG